MTLGVSERISGREAINVLDKIYRFTVAKPPRWRTGDEAFRCCASSGERTTGRTRERTNEQPDERTNKMLEIARRSKFEIIVINTNMVVPVTRAIIHDNVGAHIALRSRCPVSPKSWLTER